MSPAPSSDLHTPLPFVKTRSWVRREVEAVWQYRVGFDHENRPVRLEILAPEMPNRALAMAWRTVEGEWVGRYRCSTGYAVARLSPIERELVETAAKLALFS